MKNNCLKCQKEAKNKFCCRNCYYQHKKENLYPGQYGLGHKKYGGLKKGDSHKKISIEKIRYSLIGKLGENSRRWRGDGAGYVAKHMWISKHYGKASYCENDKSHESKMFEWANISRKYLRDRSDYKQLCKRCHVDFDRKTVCKNGHLKTDQNLYINPTNGWRSCKICMRKSQKKYVSKNFEIQSLRYGE